MNKKAILFLILAMSVLGALDSIHLLQIKYGGEAGVMCDLSETFSCSSVNHGPYADILGFPTAGIGLIGYIIIGAMSVFLIHEKQMRENGRFEKLYERLTPLSLLLVVVLGLAIQLYYTLLEIFVIEQYCIFCLASQLLIIITAILAYFGYKNSK